MSEHYLSKCELDSLRDWPIKSVIQKLFLLEYYLCNKSRKFFNNELFLDYSIYTYATIYTHTMTYMKLSHTQNTHEGLWVICDVMSYAVKFCASHDIIIFRALILTLSPSAILNSLMIKWWVLPKQHSCWPKFPK